MATPKYTDVLAQIKKAIANPKDTKLVSALDNTLATMSHSDIFQLRDAASQDSAAQNIIAPYEHRAFAREWASKDPLTAAASLVAAIPAYTAAKAVGLQGGRSSASLPELTQGFTGLGEGLMTAISNALNPAATK